MKSTAAVLACLILAGCSAEQPSADAATQTASEGGLLETTDLPPVIVIEDLVPMGFDTTTLYQIEPHFATLNTALVTLAELKRSYDESPEEERRTRLNSYAVPFHITADTHQRAILRSLEPPLDSLFDKYVEERKRAVGLRDWHIDHRQEPPASELPGLAPPTGATHQ
ncbi:MAG TPA: hypothetical protein VFO52_06660 [Longimicrobiales bacterium]|nr:hypothetical protein [Longimicrobiales bacterium]